MLCNFGQGILLEGEGSVYGRHPCTKYFRRAALNTKNIFFLLAKTRYLKEEVNSTETSPTVRIPCFDTCLFLANGARSICSFKHKVLLSLN